MPVIMPDEGFRGEEGRIGYLLRQASHAIRLKIDQSLQQYGITHPQFAVLNILGYEPGLDAADIARICMLSRQAVKTIVSNLESAGLVSFKPHEVHGRIQKIFPTALGKKGWNSAIIWLVNTVTQRIKPQILPDFHITDIKGKSALLH